MRDRFRAFVALLLVASVGWAGWLLLDPERGAAPPEPSIAGEAALPSLEPVAALAAEGREAEAIAALATLVRAVPGLADKGGPLGASAPLRELVLSRWKGVVSSAGDQAPALTRDVRFLQRRLAGGCS